MRKQLNFILVKAGNLSLRENAVWLYKKIRRRKTRVKFFAVVELLQVVLLPRPTMRDIPFGPYQQLINDAERVKDAANARNRRQQEMICKVLGDC